MVNIAIHKLYSFFQVTHVAERTRIHQAPLKKIAVSLNLLSTLFHRLGPHSAQSVLLQAQIYARILIPNAGTPIFRLIFRLGEFCVCVCGGGGERSWGAGRRPPRPPRSNVDYKAQSTWSTWLHRARGSGDLGGRSLPRFSVHWREAGVDQGRRFRVSSGRSLSLLSVQREEPVWIKTL